jgi:hypothetical protein
MMFNGDLMRDAVSIEPGSWLRQISDNKAPIAQKVNYLFAAGLARRAKPNELNIAKGLLIERKGNEAEMFQDLWWSILNSNEFILIH